MYALLCRCTFTAVCGLCAVKSHVQFHIPRSVQRNKNNIRQHGEHRWRIFYPANCPTRDAKRTKKSNAARSKEKLFNEHAFASGNMMICTYVSVDCLWYSIITGWLFAVSIFSLYWWPIQARKNDKGRHRNVVPSGERTYSNVNNLISTRPINMRNDAKVTDDKQLQNIIFILFRTDMRWDDVAVQFSNWCHRQLRLP